MSSFQEALTYRRTTKYFQADKKISRADMYNILEAGRLAPSSYGLEPWHFLVIESDSVKKAIHSACFFQPQIITASHFILILFAKPHLFTPQSAYLRSALRRQLGYNEQGIDNRCEAFIKHMKQHSLADLSNWAQMQTYIASAHMMLAAASLNIDSAAIGGFDYQSLEKAARAHIPSYNHKDYAISHGVALGYRSDSPSSQIRWPLDQVVTFI